MTHVKTEANLSVVHEKAKPVSYVSIPTNPNRVLYIPKFQARSKV